MRLLSTGTIGAASSNNLSATLQAMSGQPPAAVAIYANFTYGAGGASVDAYVQTSFDGGTSSSTWVDIAQFHFTTSAAIRMFTVSRGAVTSIATPTDGALSANTAVDGFLGSHFRVKWTSSGTYTGATSLKIDLAPTKKLGA